MQKTDLLYGSRSRFMRKTGWDSEMSVYAHERALRTGLTFFLPTK
jgi:hypothetical protein